MTGLLQTVATAPSAKPLFVTSSGVVTAGQVRSTAVDLSERLPAAARVFLHTSSASLFVAGLLAAARRRMVVCCPAHLQPHYLGEIEASGELLLTDQDAASPSAIRMALSRDAGDTDFSISGDLDLVFYTSGVTGAPKAVQKNVRQLDTEAAVLESVWPGGAQRVFGTVSHQHIYGMLFRVFWPLCTGGTSTDQPSEYWEQIAPHLSPGSTLVSGPAHLTRLPDASAFAKTAPSFVFSSGGALPLAAADAAEANLRIRPIEVLGSTETGGIAWRQQTGKETLWTLLPGVETSTENGRLIVRSPFTESGEPIETGDVVRFVGERFQLLGRGDRIAKIDGKRVSLPRVEEAVLALPIVEDAAAVDLPARKGALGVIVQLSASGRDLMKEKGAFLLSRELRAALAARLEPAERPKHWRFAPIPTNQQGKRVQELLRAAFDRTSPELLGRGVVKSVDANAAEIQIEFTKDMRWFEGHFPDQPVLAGIAQVHIAALWAENVWGWKPPSGNLSQLKFRRIMRPGDIVQLRLVRLPQRQRLKFAYHVDDVVASEGTIEEGARE